MRPLFSFGQSDPPIRKAKSRTIACRHGAMSMQPPNSGESNNFSELPHVPVTEAFVCLVVIIVVEIQPGSLAI
jgi:hypothetical protein